MASTQDDMIAELKRVIAELRRERDEALAQRSSEYSERIEHRAATIDVLKAMSASPGDPQPVFDLIVRHATDACNGLGAALLEYDGAMAHFRSMYGPTLRPKAVAAYRDLYPMVPTRAATLTRAILDRRIVHTPDFSADADLAQATRDANGKSGMALPLMRDGVVIGALGITSIELGGFSGSQIELLKTFAEQAVIAIGSAGAYRALRDRTTELAERNTAFAERIDHQAATIDVLKQMSASPGDAQPVFDLIVRNALTLCGSTNATLWEYDGTLLYRGATASRVWTPEQIEALRGQYPRPITQDPDAAVNQAILGQRIVHIRNSDQQGEEQRQRGIRSALAIPIVRDDRSRGAIGISSDAPGGFTDSQTDLLKTFAEQVAIAMSSAETFRALQTRTAELQESLEYQTATIDVLKVMSTSIGDTQPVFDTILNQAMKLCGCMLGGLVEFDGTLMHIRAAIGFDPERLAAYSSQFPRPPTRETGNGRAILDRTTQYVRDTLTDVAITPAWRALGHRSSINVPLLRGETVIGVIAVAHKDVDAFTEAHIELLKTFAEQAVIAIGGTANYRALETRTADLQESLEYQTATSDVLKVIGRSTFDLQPVLDTVVETAARLCDAEMAVLTRADGDHLRMVANHGFPPAYEAHQRSRGLIPRVPDSPSAGQRAWHERRAVHIHDAATVPGYPEASLRLANQRTTLAVPLMRDGEPIGTLSLARQRVEPFTDRQIELVSTFADQAVIAIENTRLINEQREALEQQTATADVLGVINASPGDLTPVFQAMLDRAVRLCGADFGETGTIDNDVWTTRAVAGMPPEYAQIRVNVQQQPGPGTSTWHLVRGDKVFQVADLMDTEAYRNGLPARRQMVDVGGAHALLSVALRRDDALLGQISIMRREPGAFSGRQVALLENFAAQAVIAMENARLLGELRDRTADLAERNTAFAERIDHQAATIDVLKAMSASPGDPQPVFDLICQQANTLMGTSTVGLFEYDGELVHYRSTSSLANMAGVAKSTAFASAWPAIPDRGSLTCRAILDGRIVHVRDLATDPSISRMVRDLGHRSQISVPLMRDGRAIGAISMASLRVDGFSDTQMELLKTFAEQAVIAISSAETWRALRTRTMELTERDADNRALIARQIASIEVLRAISTSPDDTQPVFELIVRHARELCDAQTAGVIEYDGTLMHTRVIPGLDPAATELLRQSFPRPPGEETVAGRAVLSGQIIHVRDTTIEANYFQTGHALGTRSMLGVPLLREGRVIGAIILGRFSSGGFDESQIALVESFADQAVIALASATTLRELRTRTADLQESLEYQTATSDMLKVISRSTFDLQPVLDTVVRTAARLCDADQAAMARREGDRWRFAANYGFPPEYEANRRATGAAPLDLTSQSVGWRTIREARPVHVHDAAAVPGYGEVAIRLGKQRTSLGVPLLREGVVIGNIMLARQRVAPFTDRQIELLCTFADQAVIAIENTRLLTEQQEALEQQTATAEVLQVINASPGNLTPVFDAMLEKAMRLSGSSFGTLFIFDGREFSFEAGRGLPAEYADFRRQHQRAAAAPGSPPARLVMTKRPVHILDFLDEQAYRDGSEAAHTLVDLGGARTVLYVPLLKDTEVAGVIVIYRQEVRAFSDKEIALLENFAAQAVIAMENARLLTEQKEALEQQTATAEVLGVINRSPGNLVPVFEAILEKAHTLCGAAIGSLYRYDGEFLHVLATHGFPEEYAALVHQPVRPPSSIRTLIEGASHFHVPDIKMIHPRPDGIAGILAEKTEARATLAVPLRKDGTFVGHITAIRTEARPFTGKEIALLENFAAQAVIAMENARLLNEVRQRQEELRITFENMGDGVAMFDETPRLVAWNRKFQDILDLPDGVLAERLTFVDYIRYLTERGEYGPASDPEEQTRRLTENAGQYRAYERTRPDGRVIEIRHNPVPGGGFVLIFADITERKRTEAEIAAARDAAEAASRTIEAAFRELKTAQANLIQAEKMASLGQLTAGIAHEIKNPLNFVNNFATLSVDLLEELKEAAAPGFAALTDDQRADIDDVSAMLTANLQKIAEHGRRADGIVKAMLEHSRGSSGERRMVDLNALVDEALSLAYHGARAQDQSFNITLERDFGTAIAPVELNPQDMTRVFLNIFTNGFYAASKRAVGGAQPGFNAILKVATRAVDDAVEIRVRDNGTGIPENIRDKLFQPFFTTKPTGEGTGLGLSITYDIVTKAHGGTITVDSEVGAFTEFVVTLPRRMFGNEETSQ